MGADTELDRTVVDAIGDPLVHLVRNAVDHGLESADDREASGKPRHGTISLVASQAGGSVIIEVRDDGRGIDPAAIGRKAASLGLIDAQAASDIDVRTAIELLFAPGFTTSETTSDISGRGVGMDAVRAKIRQLGGEVVIDSEPGVGYRRADPPAVDAGDRLGPAGRGGGRAVRIPDRSHRAHAAPVRRSRALGGRAPDAGARRRRAAARRRRRDVQAHRGRPSPSSS